ncbi:DUF4181 domain-containing protein [Metaplanococcus flavidus]|uniref:DUF4181 domain-containing protein n=1 Tax=Metaplanococcus flavidus TaxID=569883 RepID=A0ABW3LE50_9BACL
MFDIYFSFASPLMPESFGWRFTLFIAGSISIIYLVDLFLRKLLGVEKRKLFKSRYVNDRHKKVDFYLRIAGAVFLVAALAYGYENGPLYPIVATIGAALMSALYQAYMEKRYAENPGDHLYTILEFPLTIIPVLILGGTLFPEIPLY